MPGVSRRDRKSDPVCLVLGVRIGAVAARCSNSAVDGDDWVKEDAEGRMGDWGIEKLIRRTGDPNLAANVLKCETVADGLYMPEAGVPEKTRDACDAKERSSCSRADSEGDRWDTRCGNADAGTPYS